MNNDPNMHNSCIHRVSWSAVFVGALVGIGLAFLLNLFSVAIGLTAFTPSQTGMVTLAVGGIVGLAIGTFVSMYLCGFSAGYLGRRVGMNRNMGVLYGFTAWCLALVLSGLFAAQLGRYVETYTHYISHNSTSAVVLADKDQSKTVENPNPISHQNGAMVVDADKASDLGSSAFVVFLLFFIGAVSSCFGGYYGMACRENNCN